MALPGHGPGRAPRPGQPISIPSRPCHASRGPNPHGPPPASYPSRRARATSPQPAPPLIPSHALMRTRLPPAGGTAAAQRPAACRDLICATWRLTPPAPAPPPVGAATPPAPSPRPPARPAPAGFNVPRVSAQRRRTASPHSGAAQGCRARGVTPGARVHAPQHVPDKETDDRRRGHEA